MTARQWQILQAAADAYGFFLTPRSWCDHRPAKTTAMCPDFIEPPARETQ